jgi:MFS family permease
MNKQLMVAIIIASSSIIFIGSDICLPSIPHIAEQFAVSDANAQLAITLFFAGQVLSTLFWGRFSDRLGRCKTFFWGMVVFWLGTLICMVQGNLHLFLLGRLIEGVGSVAVPVVGWAIIHDLYPKDKSAHAMTWIGGIVSIAPMIAPVLGGVIDKQFGWQASFYFIAIISFIILLALKNMLREKQEVSKVEGNVFKTYSEIIRNKVFVSYIWIFGLLSCGEWCFLTVAPFFYKNTLGLNVETIGFMMSISTGFYVIGTLIANHLLKRMSIDVLLRLGNKISLIASILFLMFYLFAYYNALLITLAFGLYVLGASILWGITSSRALQCYEMNRGAASAIRSLMLISSFTIGSFIGTLIDNSDLLQVSLVLIGFSLASARLYYSKPLITHRQIVEQ